MPFEVLPQKDGNGLRIIWDDNASPLYADYEIQYELKDDSQLCFARLSSSFATKQITLDEYLDGVLGHLKKSSPARHTFDAPLEESQAEYYVAALLACDIFTGSVKALVWSNDFVLLEDAEWQSLRNLAALAWTCDDPDEFQSKAREQQLEVSTLPPEASDLLLVICYCLRHVKLFEFLIDSLPTPGRSSFDQFSGIEVKWRVRSDSKHYQHSPKGPQNVPIEAQLMTLLLRSKRLHDPINDEIARSLQFLGQTLVSQKTSPDSWSLNYSSPVLHEFHSALASRDLVPSLTEIGDFLEDCPSIDVAEQFFTNFTGAMISNSPTFYREHSGSLLVPIVESRKIGDKLRVDIMRLILKEFNGLDIDAPIHRPWLAELRSFGRPDQPEDMFNPLMAAAWRGDKEMAQALIDNGADLGFKDILSHQYAASVARQNGQDDFAGWFDDLLEAKGIVLLP
ncbi:hypothetical protein FSARC_1095 [Fusarium sarcochroum]|uniref:Ankyrin repeat protein n=1 Tax=Fusarium sarcochroum TaxID=1208366 RepID=A0A8H4XFI4_9HYPO|nr:hypothetical protein FSARC_1095 [Fusarium sarcochroum]